MPVQARISGAKAPAASGNGATAASPEKPDPSAMPKKPASDPLHPVVRMETSYGNILVQLDGVLAPLAVDNFLAYVNAGQYDQTIVHQIYKGQGVVGGGYGVNLVEKRSRTPVLNEAHNGVKNLRGTIAMVRQPDSIDSATCQFFINIADNPALDHKDRTPEGYGYCVFGTVTEGMDVVDRMNEAAVHDTPNFERTPVQSIVITSIRRIR